MNFFFKIFFAKNKKGFKKEKYGMCKHNETHKLFNF